MSWVIEWMAAEAERPKVNVPQPTQFSQKLRDPSTSLRAGVGHPQPAEISAEAMPAHQFPGKILRSFAPPDGRGRPSPHEPYPQEGGQAEPPAAEPKPDQAVEQERRIYRGRTVGMLRRYMRYAIETGRLPSLLGREFFRAKVTKYSVVTFEDRVIFVHDMEMCLEKLDEFSRQIIARHILQEHDCWATARLLACNEKTVRRLTPIALDLLSDILLEVGLLERIENGKNSCQGGARGEISVSDCEDTENKV